MDNRFDASRLVWEKEDGYQVMKLSSEQWSQVHDLLLNVFYDDGEGFIDLGLDNMYAFTEKGALVGDYDCTWIGIDNQVVAYYYEDTLVDGDKMITSGRVPCLLNGERANLLLVFENDLKTGDALKDYVAGVRYDYINGETEATAKNAELQVGDKLEFVCDYYDYKGNYQNSYLLGDPITWNGNNLVGYTDMGDQEEALTATYLFRDIYDQEYWTAPMANSPLED